MNIFEISEIKKKFGINNIDKSWGDFFKNHLKKNNFYELLIRINEEYKKKICWPSKEKVFRIFQEVPLKNIKVIILGQDPYHTPEVADGFSFSSGKDNYIPLSLKNIFLELKEDLKTNYLLKNGNLINWVKQGVFLLNTSLTVIESKPLSHIEIWEFFCKKIIKYLVERKKDIIWIFLGKRASNLRNDLNIKIEEFIETSHPSPYSANLGFFGSKIFSKINKILKEMNKEEIKWLDN